MKQNIEIKQIEEQIIGYLEQRADRMLPLDYCAKRVGISSILLLSISKSFIKIRRMYQRTGEQRRITSYFFLP
ncbi:TPA: hypothetical protein I0H43_RS03200 [Enterococcus faecalis]|nr:hypothetical protein [Enterococcus faecalis]